MSFLSFSANIDELGLCGTLAFIYADKNELHHVTVLGHHVPSVNDTFVMFHK